MLYQPSGRNGPSPQRRKYTKKYNLIGPHPPEPPRPAGVTIVAPTTAIVTHTHTHTHNLAAQCAQAGRNTIGTWLCTRPRHCDCVDMPDAGLHPHREAMHKQHTHSQGHRAVCPSATQMSIRKRDRTTPRRNAATAAQTHWYQSTMWRGPTRSTTSPKKGKRATRGEARGHP